MYNVKPMLHVVQVIEIIVHFVGDRVYFLSPVATICKLAIEQMLTTWTTL